MKRVIAQIYSEKKQGMYALALSIVRNPQVAEDVIHDAVMRVLAQPEEKIKNPVAYLFQSVRNAAIEVTRKKVLDAGQYVNELYDKSALSPSDYMQQGELIGQVEKALALLDTQQREVVMMKIYGDLTFKQIAQITNEPLATVATRYRRSIEQLNEYCRSEQDEQDRNSKLRETASKSATSSSILIA